MGLRRAKKTKSKDTKRRGKRRTVMDGWIERMMNGGDSEERRKRGKELRAREGKESKGRGESGHDGGRKEKGRMVKRGKVVVEARK